MKLKPLILLGSVFAMSTAVVIIKMVKVDPATLAAYRQFLAALVLAPLFLRGLKDFNYTQAHLRHSMFAGVVLGLHFVSWIIGVRMTLAANSALMVNLVPAFSPIFLFLMVKEKLNRKELLATGLSLLGVVLLLLQEFQVSNESVSGVVVCILSINLYIVYIVLARRNKDRFNSVFVYIVPLYVTGGLVALAASFLLGENHLDYPLTDWLWVLALGLIPTVLGHSGINWSMRHFRGQTVALASLNHFIFTTVLAYFFLQEVPGSSFYLAVLFIVPAALLAILNNRENTETTN